MIQKADARVRGAVLVGIVAMVAIGIVLMARADSYRSAVMDWVMQDPTRSRSRAVTVSIALAGAVVLPVLGAALYLWRFGIRVVHDQRFPPHGAMLLVDTVILEGAEAYRRGRMLQALAIGLGATGLVFAIMFWRLIVLTTPRVQ